MSPQRNPQLTEACESSSATIDSLVAADFLNVQPFAVMKEFPDTPTDEGNPIESEVIASRAAVISRLNIAGDF